MIMFIHLSGTQCTRNVTIWHCREMWQINMIFLTTNLLLGAFAKLLKATVSVFISVFQSVRMEQIDFHWTIFHEM